MGTDEKLQQLRKKKSDLSDIILEKERGNSEKIKKLLLGGASLILLFLIVLIIMKMLNNPDEAVMTENLASTQTASPAVTPKEPESTESASDDEGLFKQEPIIDEGTETDLKFEEMVRKLKEQDGSLQSVEETPEEKTPPATKPEAKPKPTPTPVVAESKPEPVAKSTKPETKPKTALTTPKAAPKVEKPAPKREVIVSETKPKPLSKPVKTASISGYFIQVGATSRSFPDRRFLRKIKQSGYDYIVHKVTVKGRTIKKVLVGPYPTKEAARRALPGVRSTINPDAFVFRMK